MSPKVGCGSIGVNCILDYLANAQTCNVVLSRVAADYHGVPVCLLYVQHVQGIILGI